VLKLADAAIFNLIIGNADAHAKNYSLLRRESGEVVLAPLYDLVATHMWNELSPKLAMRFGRGVTLEDFDRESVERLAEEAGLRAPYIRRRMSELAEAMRQAIEKGVPVAGIPPKEVVALVAEALSARASIVGPKPLGN
jgi:serine/threonine-protein kinase HipA